MRTIPLEGKAALAAALAIAAAAFGAHAAVGEVAELLRTGGQYLLIHAIAVFALGERHRAPAALMLGGAMLFAGSLFALAGGAPRWLGAITPIGGLMMIGGWLWVAYRTSSSRNA